MKTMKKFAALLLVVALMAAMLVVPANAAEETTITVTKPLAGIEYKVYKMFDLSYGDNAYSYTINSEWSDFFASKGASYVTVTDGYVTKISDPAALAKLAAANVPAGASVLASCESADTTDFTFVDGSSNPVKFGPGYYLVVSNAGTAGMLNTATGESGNITIEEKNKLPSIDKAIGAVDYVPGNNIPFTVTVTTEQGGIDYVVHDHMGSGLQFNGVVVVTVGGVTVDPANYTVKTSGLACNDVNCKLEIEFNNDYIGGLAALTEIVITYSAKMLPSGDYTNQATITSGGGMGGDNPSTEIIPSEVDFSKVDSKGNALSGAKFKLYQKDGETKKYASLTGAGTKADPYIAESWGGGDGTVIDQQKFYIKALTQGTYYLEEIEAPAGYNNLTAPIVIDITEVSTTDTNGDTKVTYTVKIDGKDTTSAQIENKAGGEFPTTGGVGTTIFYCLGGILVLAAIVFLVTKRRVAED